VDLYERLVEQIPALIGELGDATNLLAIYLCAVGRDEQALKWTERAAEVLESVAAVDPSALKRLASALPLLIRGYDMAARREDSARVAERAVALWERLAGEGLESVSHLAGS
jgi:hypothetical protein